MMKSILKSKKGISPILATLLLIVIAVAAVIVTYAWVMTFTESTTESAGAVLKTDNVRFYTTGSTPVYYVEVIVRNSGTGNAEVDAVYAGTSTSSLAAQTGITYNPSSKIVAAGSTLNVTIPMTWASGTTYHFKITTEEGFEIPFSKEA
ncbi:MAG: hypothetical protein CW691_01465 [Candidatus Bathyarchaeum sp.]|nr:MAG: hypothetical protein CW691_01465 [Candidatus Bathyarchaeum sp.]